MSTVGGIHRAFEQATEWRCNCIQIYTTPSRQWNVPPLDPGRRDVFRGARRDSGVQVVVAHVPFLVNLASPNPEAWSRSRERLIEELVRAEELGVSSVILHPGSGGTGPRDDATARVITALKEVLAETDGLAVRILIENMAGQGGTLCAEFEELAHLLEAVGHDRRVGVCFDTAHAFIAGHPLFGYRGYREVMDRFDRVVGCGRIHALHVNDSLTPLGSRNDRHAAVGAGYMGLQVFHALMRDQRFANVPKVIEVPDRDNDSLPVLQLLRQLHDRDHPVAADASLESEARLRLDQLGGMAA